MSSAADTAEVTAAVSTDASPGAASKENQPKDSNAATPAASSATGSINTPSSTTGTKGTPAAQPSAVEFEPPAACIRRILKNTLHAHTNVGKDSVTAFARATGIFIIYLTACANDFARENRRQTITANDVLAAIKELEFDEFTPELTAFLEQYRELERNKKDAKAKAVAAKKAAESTATTPSTSVSSPSKNDNDEESSKLATPLSATSSANKGEDDEDEDNEDGDASMADNGDEDDDDDDQEGEEDDMAAEDPGDGKDEAMEE